MVKIKKIYEELRLSAVMPSAKHDNLVETICSQASNVEYIGYGVDKERQSFYFIRYNNEIYCSNTWVAYGSEYILRFSKFKGKIEDIEPLENYKYYIDYCNPAVDDEACYIWYYKADELEEAQKRQNELGKDLAFLKEI